jgi:hypothetical protein
MSYGTLDLGQLAQAMAGAADALVVAVQAGIAYIPDGASLASAVAQLANGTRAFRDAVFANQRLPVLTATYNQMDALAGQLNQYFAANPATPQAQAGWQSFAALEVQAARALQAAIPQPGIPTAPYAPAGVIPAPAYPPGMVGPSPVAGLADQLLGETSAFIAAFSPTAGRVPEGRFMLAEAQQLEAAAAQFRQAAFGGLAPDQLARAFGGVAACWEQLGQRVERVARGRFGPNIAQVQKLGVICSQIGQTLGMPGY